MALQDVPYAEEIDWPDGLTPFDAQSFAIQANPFPHFAWMRERAPVLKARTPHGDLWFVSQYHNVLIALRNPKLFSSSVIDPDVLPLLTLMDPPMHTRLRETVARAFTPKAVGRFEAQIRDMAHEFLDPLVEAGGGSIVEEFAVRLTIGTIGSLLGIPVSEAARIKAWTEDYFNYFGRLARYAPGSPQDEQGVDEFLKFLKQVLENAATVEEETVVANLAKLWKTSALSERETLHFCALLFAGGNDTTTILIANGFLTLSEQQDLFGLLRRDGTYISKFVGELLRFRSPIQRISRITTQEVELHGHVVPKGSHLRLLPGSANRDAAKFPDGERFDIQRDTTGQIGFGYGIHACLGMWLAQLEARVAFDVVSERVSSVELDGSAPMLFYEGGTMAQTGPRSMQVRFM